MNRLILTVLLAHAALHASDLYVSTVGNDGDLGTQAKLLRTLAAAQRRARSVNATVVHVCPGVYYLPEALIFT